MLAALICGPGPGLLVMALGAIIAPYLFMEPYWSFDKFAYRHLLPICIFTFSGLIVSYLAWQAQRRSDEAREANRQLQAAMKELQRSNQELDEFAFVASHDLKEPLRGLHNYASFLREDYGERLDDEGLHYIERMQRLAERLGMLIDRLLAYSRVGSTELTREAVDLEALLDAVADDIGPFLGEAGARLVRVGALPSVPCNALRVGEVLQNLITNGAKYNDKPDKVIEVGCDRDASPPVFHVRDNGIGIAPHHRDSVFRIFKRLHEQDKYGGGSGAGLTIVRKIVERHGGRIWLESTPGQGSIFYFTLSD
jgi:chemotaxis family two-component system sensor kinase Cph1